MDDAVPSARRLRGRLQKASEVVAQEIVLDIASSSLKPGDRLPQEPEMKTKYGVARSTIREALRILEVNGLITMRSGPGGGPSVRRAAPADLGRAISLFLQSEKVTLKEVLEARRLLEPAFVRQATRIRDPQFISKLHELKRRGREVDVEDDESYLALTGEFHDVMAGSSSIRVLTALVRALMSMFVGKVTKGIFRVDQRRHVLQEHEEIMDAIISGNETLAEQLMTKHMDHFLAGIAARQSDAYYGLVKWE